jgi:hypothetical protein
MFLNDNDKVLKVGSKVRLNPDIEETGSAYLIFNTVYTISNIIGTYRSYMNDLHKIDELVEWQLEVQVEGQPIIETWYPAFYFELVD